MLTGKEAVDSGIVEKGETVTFGYYTVFYLEITWNLENCVKNSVF